VAPEAPVRPEGPRAARGAAACEQADARDSERAAREHRMRSRCAAGAEGASAAEGRVAPPPHQRLSAKKLLGPPEWGFQPAVAPPLWFATVGTSAVHIKGRRQDK
jgi:hypothetical protein